MDREGIADGVRARHPPGRRDRDHMRTASAAPEMSVRAARDVALRLEDGRTHHVPEKPDLRQAIMRPLHVVTRPGEGSMFEACGGMGGKAGRAG